MLRPIETIHDHELGFSVSDDRLPLIRLREKRRELVMALASSPLTNQATNEIAAVHQAIKAIEAVIAE